MLKTMSIFTALSTLGLALMGDFKGTVINITAIVTLRGASYLTEKLLEVLDKDMKGVVNLTSYCLCGISFIKILKSAQSVLMPLAGLIS